MPTNLQRHSRSRHRVRKRIKYVAWILLLVPSIILATPQIPDKIRIGDVKAPLCMSPILAPYFVDNPERDIRKAAKETYEPCMPEPEPDEITIMGSTALRRGYSASFAIVNDQLVVEQIWTDRGIGWDDSWAAVIDCAMPDSNSRHLDWFSGPLFYLQVEPVGNDADGSDRYSLIQLDIDAGHVIGSRTLTSEIHGPSSGVSCSAGWDEEQAEGPTTYGWCEVDSIDAKCAD